MSTVVEVKLWGTTVGAVLLEDGAEAASFQYAAGFAGSGIEVAPLVMPLGTQVYRFPELAQKTFHGLPGLVADSLPDRFGNAVIDAWLAREGRSPGSMNAAERLCYTGMRGMGALEFEPASGPAPQRANDIQIEHLVGLASEILRERGGLQGSFLDGKKSDALREILRVGTSAGGARAKAVIAWNPSTNEVRSGQVDAGDGFEYWLLKFDGVAENRDKELNDPAGYGLIEYAYSLMAKAAGIEMAACRIFEENDRHHFMTRRFDRTLDGGKLHMQSLCALGHYDFNMAGAHGYEQALQVAHRLQLPMHDVEQLYRRMAFNIVARNQDDHVKNIAFLMDRRGGWSLAPAFDVTYSYNPEGAWTARHQMTLNGKSDDFEWQDFLQCARTARMKRGRARQILDEVQAAVSRWLEFAEEAGVARRQREAIGTVLRLQPFR